MHDATQYPVDPAGARLAGLLHDPNGLKFTVRFIDEVVRPEDHSAAAQKLRELAPMAPRFLGPLRPLIRVGAVVSHIAPGLVVPIARRALRTMVSHLIIDATDAKLGAAIERVSRQGVRLNVTLIGEYILGQHEADRRLAGTQRLLDRSDVDYVSIKVSSTVAPHSHWAVEEAVAHMEERLLRLYTTAAAASPHKFINLDMEEYSDLDVTIAVFKKILSRPEFLKLEAGIVLQAYLPDALGVMMDLQAWAAERISRGGAPIKVRVVKGANLPMETVEARIHGWPKATWNSKQESDTSYKAVLDYALTPERTAHVKIGVAGHNLFDIALAWLLATDRGVESDLDVEMLLGMATGQAEAVRKDVGGLLLYTPVVHPREFDVAIAYLVRRLEEGASHENFMSAVFDWPTARPSLSASGIASSPRWLIWPLSPPMETQPTTTCPPRAGFRIDARISTLTPRCRRPSPSSPTGRTPTRRFLATGSGAGRSPHAWSPVALEWASWSPPPCAAPNSSRRSL